MIYISILQYICSQPAACKKASYMQMLNELCLSVIQDSGITTNMCVTHARTN